MTDHTELDAFIASLTLEYSATFVPQSQSRNANEKNHSLNWRVSVMPKESAGRTNLHLRIMTDYMQGIGHVPEDSADLFKRYGHSCSIARDAYERQIAQTGKYGPFHSRPLPPPALRDVLYSLMSDGAASETTFEEWASEYGYGTDSRKAEEMYRTCDEHGKKLTRMIGTNNLAKLRELFQDY